MKLRIVAVFILAIMFVFVVEPAIAYRGQWLCVTTDMIPLEGTPFIATSGRILESMWVTPAFRYEGTWCSQATYYVLWEWDDWEDYTYVQYSMTGRGLILDDMPSKGYVVLRLTISSTYADSYVKATYKQTIKPAVYRQMKEMMDRYGVRELIEKFRDFMIVSGVALAIADAVAAALLGISILYGATFVWKMITNPLTITCEIGGGREWNEKVCEKELAWFEVVRLSANAAYDSSWGFTYYDRASCTGCFWSFCYGCQKMQQPSFSAGIGVMVDPDATTVIDETTEKIVMIIAAVNTTTRDIRIAVIVRTPLTYLYQPIIYPQGETLRIDTTNSSLHVNVVSFNGEVDLSKLTIQIENTTIKPLPLPREPVSWGLLGVYEWVNMTRIGNIAVITIVTTDNPSLVRVEGTKISVVQTIDPVPVAAAGAAAIGAAVLLGIKAMRQTINEVFRKRRFVREETLFFTMAP